MHKKATILFIKSISIICLLSIGLLITNNALFIHTHQLADGEIITHAHPYNKSENSNQQHKHTNFELFILSQLQIFVLLSIAGFVFYKSIILIKVELLHKQLSFHISYSLGAPRAPPVAI